MACYLIYAIGGLLIAASIILAIAVLAAAGTVAVVLAIPGLPFLIPLVLAAAIWWLIRRLNRGEDPLEAKLPPQRSGMVR